MLLCTNPSGHLPDKKCRIIREKRASNRLSRCLTARRMQTIGHHRYCVTGYLMMGAAGSKTEKFLVYRAISQVTFFLETPLICIGIHYSLDGRPTILQ